jgi:hypothetical protein
MKLYPVLLLFLFCLVTGVKAQNNIIKSLERQEPGCGTVTIHQDGRLESLIGSQHAKDAKVLKESGYRILVFSGGDSREARNAAYEIEGKVKNYFPQLPVYTIFISPRWLCQAGDYKTIEEAYAMMRKMKQIGAFNEVSIVRTQIIIPL